MEIKNIMLIILLPLLLLSVFFSCAPADSKIEGEEAPRWLTNPREEYPENRYLVARGQAHSEAGATNNARTEMARIFNQQIESQEVISEEILETFSDDNTGKFQQEVSRQQQIVVETDEEIMGLEIKEFFQDKKNNMYYALAVLERSSARNIYRDHLDRDNQRLSSYYDRAQSEDLNNVQKLQNLAKARAHAENAVKLQQHLKVINPDRQPPRLTVNPVEIEQKINDLLNKLTITVEPIEESVIFEQHEINRRIEEWINNTFADLDFQIAPEESILAVKTTFNADWADRRRADVTFIRWNINISLHDNDRQTEIGSISYQTQSGGINEVQAKNRTQRDIQSWIENNLSELIVRTLLTT